MAGFPAAIPAPHYPMEMILLFPPPTAPFTPLRRSPTTILPSLHRRRSSTTTLYLTFHSLHHRRRCLIFPPILNPHSLSSSSSISSSSSTEEEPTVSILSVLRSHDIPEEACTTFVSRCPERFRRMKPQKTLHPKIEFLRSSACLSGAEVGEILLANPYILRSKLHPTLSSFVAFLSAILPSKEDLVTVLKSVLCSPTDRIIANIQILRDRNVPEKVIHKILLQYPRSIVASTPKFVAILDAIEKLGLPPTDPNFAGAVSTAPYTTKESFSRKVELFKELGWSEEQVLSMFRRTPTCINISEAKLRESFAYANEVLGWGPEVFCANPRLLTLSLEERIIPRSAVLHVLKSRGLLRKNSKHLRKFMVNDNSFFANYVDKYEGEIASEVLKAYGGNKKKKKRRRRKQRRRPPI